MKINCFVRNSIFVLFFLALSVSLITQSCSKDENASKNETSSNIVSFDSQQELQTTINKVLSMNIEELKAYETSKGYKSLGRKCEELYAGTDFEKFKSIDEIKAFVESKSEYLKIVEDGEGELVVETTISSSPYRYFTNSDRLFQVKDEIYKVFEDGLVATNAKNIKKLKSLKSFPSNGLDKELRVMPSYKQTLNSESKLKDASYNCGTHKEVRATSDRDRTLLEIGIYYLHSYDNSGIPMTVYETRVLVRPYKKTLGIWYWCSRTLSCDIKVAVDVNTTSGWERGYYYKNEPGKYDSKLEYTIAGGIVSWGSHATFEMHFGGFDSWAKSPSTGYALAQCNTNLF